MGIFGQDSDPIPELNPTGPQISGKNQDPFMQLLVGQRLFHSHPQRIQISILPTTGIEQLVEIGGLVLESGQVPGTIIGSPMFFIYFFLVSHSLIGIHMIRSCQQVTDRVAEADQHRPEILPQTDAKSIAIRYYK